MTALVRRTGRAVWALVPVLLGALVVTVIVFLVAALPWLRDEDPAASVLLTRYPERGTDPATLAALRDELGLPDDPVAGALGWLGGLLRGDPGVSWVSQQPLGPGVLTAFGVSLTLAVAATVIAAATATALLAPGVRAGVRAATGDAERPSTAAGGAAGGTIAAGVLAALPEVVLGAVLVAVVAVGWGLLPSSGWAGPAHLVLPALALGLPAGGLLARMLSSTVESTVGEAWVRSWASWAVPTGRIARAVARRAVALAAPQLALLVVGLLGSAVTVELLFGIPGVGSTALDAVLAQDLPVVQFAVVLLVGLGLVLGGIGALAHRTLLGPALTGAELPAGMPRAGTGTGRPAAIAGAVLGLLVVAGLPRDAAAVDLAGRLAAPSLAHPMGTDAVGRDLWARFASGAVLTVGTALVVVAVSLVIGVVGGLVAWTGRGGVSEVVNALPPVFVGLLVAAAFGPGLLGAAAAVAAVGWVPLAVHTRTLAVEARGSGYVRAARLAGASWWRVMTRHVFPAVRRPVLRHALARVPHAALGIAALSFIGIGAPPDSPEWGAMLAESLLYLASAPWTILAPCTGLVLLAVCATRM